MNTVSPCNIAGGPDKKVANLRSTVINDLKIKEKEKKNGVNC